MITRVCVECTIVHSHDNHTCTTSVIVVTLHHTQTWLLNLCAGTCVHIRNIIGLYILPGKNIKCYSNNTSIYGFMTYV